MTKLTAPLVLLHGLGSSREVWDPLLPHLDLGREVIAIDLPGHGSAPRLRPGDDPSPVGMAHYVARQLSDRAMLNAGIHVAGSSLGGWVGLELAKLGYAASVTAFAPAGLWRSDLVPVVAHVNRWLARLTSPIASPLLRQRPLRAIGMWSASTHAADLDVQTAIDAAHAHAHASGWAAALNAAQQRQFDPIGFPEDIPVTIVWGDHDRILPANRCQELAHAPSLARWVRLNDCGHVPMWDQPQASAELIASTIRSASAADRSQPTGRSANRQARATG